MRSAADDLRDAYRRMDEEELTSRVRSGTLTLEAHHIALEELASRGVGTQQLSAEPQRPALPKRVIARRNGRCTR